MASELNLTYQGTADVYAIIRRHDDSQAWNASDGAFQTWSDGTIADYGLALTDRGGDLHQGDWPADITPGRYRVMYYRQAGDAPATDDLLLGTSDAYWTGQAIVAPGGDAEEDANDLTTLAAVKRYLRIDHANDDALLADLVHLVSRRIERLCGRHFKLRAHRHRHPRPGDAVIVLREYPVVSVDRVRSGRAAALRVTHYGLSLAATVQVTHTAIRLAATDDQGEVIAHDLPFDDHPTTSRLADAIDELTGWTAEVIVNVPSRDLLPCAGADVRGRVADLAYPDQMIAVRSIDHDSGTLLLDAEGAAGDVYVEYHAGYETIPPEIDLVARELVAEAYHLGRHDTSSRNEQLGDYARTLVSAVGIADGQIARLRLFMAITFATG